jgi:protein-disulfide isomerase
VEEDNRSAVNLKLQGTPTLLVNGQVIENWGDYTALVTTIEAAINKAGQ